MSDPPRSCRSSARAVPSARAAVGQERRYTIAFANLTEEPGVTFEGTGFTGGRVRSSFALAARKLPVDLVFYDNQRDATKAQANAEDAVARKVNLYIQYFAGLDANAAIAAQLKAAGIPMLAVNYPVPGAPLYTADNSPRDASRGGARRSSPRARGGASRRSRSSCGPVEAKADRVPERVQGVVEALRAEAARREASHARHPGQSRAGGALLGEVSRRRIRAPRCWWRRRTMPPRWPPRLRSRRRARLGRRHRPAMAWIGASTAGSTTRRRSIRTTGAAS